jgi:hypothetical protein
MQVKEEEKVFKKTTKKNDDFFQSRKQKPIPSENRHLSKKPISIPTEVKKSSPQGSTLNYSVLVPIHIESNDRYFNISYTKSPPSLMIAPILSDFFMRFRE